MDIWWRNIIFMVMNFATEHLTRIQSSLHNKMITRLLDICFLVIYMWMHERLRYDLHSSSFCFQLKFVGRWLVSLDLGVLLMDFWYPKPYMFGLHLCQWCNHFESNANYIKVENILVALLLIEISMFLSISETTEMMNFRTENLRCQYIMQF